MLMSLSEMAHQYTGISSLLYWNFTKVVILFDRKVERKKYAWIVPWISSSVLKKRDKPEQKNP